MESCRDVSWEQDRYKTLRSVKARTKAIRKVRDLQADRVRLLWHAHKEMTPPIPTTELAAAAGMSKETFYQLIDREKRDRKSKEQDNG